MPVVVAQPRGQRDWIGAGLEPGPLTRHRGECGRTHGFDLDRLAAGLGDHDGLPVQCAVDQTGKLVAASAMVKVVMAASMAGRRMDCPMIWIWVGRAGNWQLGHHRRQRSRGGEADRRALMASHRCRRGDHGRHHHPQSRRFPDIRLRIQAAVLGRSMEDEARDVLRCGRNQVPQEPRNLARRSTTCSGRSVGSTCRRCRAARCVSRRGSTEERAGNPALIRNIHRRGIGYDIALLAEGRNEPSVRPGLAGSGTAVGAVAAESGRLPVASSRQISTHCGHSWPSKLLTRRFDTAGFETNPKEPGERARP